MIEDSSNAPGDPQAEPPAAVPPSEPPPPAPAYTAQQQAAGGNPKTKVVSILLAVFLGFWTWLYTYRADGGKFWLGLIVTAVTIGIAGIVFWIWAIIDTVSKSDEWYATYD